MSGFFLDCPWCCCVAQSPPDYRAPGKPGMPGDDEFEAAREAFILSLGWTYVDNPDGLRLDQCASCANIGFTVDDRVEIDAIRRRAYERKMASQPPPTDVVVRHEDGSVEGIMADGRYISVRFAGFIDPEGRG